MAQLEKSAALKGLPAGPMRWLLQANAALVLSSLGAEAEALPSLATAYAGLAAAVGEGHPEAVALLVTRTRVEITWGRIQDAQRCGRVT